jgi:hypothetical protein
MLWQLYSGEKALSYPSLNRKVDEPQSQFGCYEEERKQNIFHA